MSNLTTPETTFEIAVKLDDREGSVVRPVDLEKDYPKISAWCRDYGLHLEKEDLGKVGFIVDDLAAVWLLTTNSNTVFAEPLIGNPNADPKDRSEALDMLSETIAEYSRSLGAKYLKAYTSNPAVIKRCLSQDFKEDSKTWMLLTRRL